jgi:DNA topoisomerase-2
MPPKKEVVQKLTHVQHILKRPDSYVGSTTHVTEPYWVLRENNFAQETVSYSPALLKIFDEILVNAIDRNSLFPQEVKNIKVQVDMEAGIISIENDGPLGGVSVEEHPTEKTWNPELTFGHLLTSTNYDDDDERVVGGRNGYGAKLTNVYSKVFSITIKDPTAGLKYSQCWEENMTICKKPKITKYSGAVSSVCITFVPDWEKFGMTGLSPEFYKIIEKRVWDAMICTDPKCKITFQGQVVKHISSEQYAKMYIGKDVPCVSLNSDRWAVTIAPSEDGFQQVSFVNGICTTHGGTHVNHVSYLLSAGIIEELGKKVKLQAHMVKSHLFVFVRATLVNPTFSSQVKSECTLKVQKFGSVFTPTQAFVRSVLKTGIQEELISISKFKEQKELKKTDGARRSKIAGIPKLDDANKAGTIRGAECTLIITEGDSAKALAIAGLSIVGRDLFGVFPLRGKPKNVREASVKQLLSNQEFSDLKKILGLQQDKVYTSLSDLRYGRLMIMTDADTDGSHIKGLVLNMIHYFWPSLIDLGFCVSMVTPIIKATRGKESKWFFTESSFRKWDAHGWKIKYYKGLGTSTSLEAREYFKQLCDLTVRFDPDPTMDESIVLAFDKTKADARKKWLIDNTEMDPSVRELNYGSLKELSVSEFIHRDMVNFSLADLRRSVAHMCDGLKPSQRKVLYACFKKNLREEMKVAQLAAYVSEKTSYHHGEVSLADTIVKLAHDYVGSNNVNYLEPCGQFGTRLMGGKDASQTRYIFTHLTPQARKFFDPRDDPVLNYLTDDGKLIEPEYFVPVVPSVLINGTEGIGTGFSTNIPPFNPQEIVNNVERALQGKNLVKMKPWFRGFRGTIREGDTDQSWTATGTYMTSKNLIKITELPPTRWTQDYKEFLETIQAKGVISGYENKSTTESVLFEIQGYQGNNLHKDLRLEKTFHTSNMHLFHPQQGIKKYSTPEEILVDFLEIRLDYYKARKENMVENLEKLKIILENKARFVKMVTDEELVVFKKRKSDLEREIKGLNFVKIDESFDYLLGIKTYQYTLEEMEKLYTESERIARELGDLRGTSILDMYRSDLSQLVAASV